VAEQTLAMEQFRLELVGQSADVAVVERRLVRLRRRLAAHYAAAGRDLTRDRQALEAEAARLETEGRAIDRQAGLIAKRDVELGQKVADWEAAHARIEEAHAAAQAEVQRLRLHFALQERQLGALHEEIERMALGLIERDRSELESGAQAA
jgi:hypothetical protein